MNLPMASSWNLRIRLWVLLIALVLPSRATVLTNLLELGHVDIRVQWSAAAAATNSPEALFLGFHVDALGGNVSADEYAVRIPEAARLEIPDGFDVFGAAGSSLWILPQSQTPGLLYLGISAEGLPRDVVTGPVFLRLVGFQGAGDFFAWQSDGLGSVEVVLSTRDGITDSDRLSIPVGGHAHYNFGFTSNGVHEVLLQVVAGVAGQAGSFLGRTNRLQFQVEPLPPVVETPWSRWVAERFGPSPDPVLAGPDADPDGDGFPNLHEFLSGTDPRDASSRAPLRILGSPAGGGLGLRLAIDPNRLESVIPVVEQSSDVRGPWTEAGSPRPSAAETELEFPIPDPAASGTRFHRLRLQLR